MGSGASKSTKVQTVPSSEADDDDVVVVSKIAPSDNPSTSAPSSLSKDKDHIKVAKNKTATNSDNDRLSPSIQKNMHRDDPTPTVTTTTAAAADLHYHGISDVASPAGISAPLAPLDRQSSVPSSIGPESKVSQRSSKASLVPPHTQEHGDAKAHFPGTEQPKTEEQLLLEAIDRKVEAKAKPDVPQPPGPPPGIDGLAPANRAGISVNVRDIDDAMNEIGSSLANINEESEHALQHRKPQVQFDPDKFRRANNGGLNPSPSKKRIALSEVIDAFGSLRAFSVVLHCPLCHVRV
ncbi:hypothetical protein PTSG_10795 [Salpingoeca rosetta]|uniref:Uncharacterized protein n=1 Tax=Salpingoeca rosetta (strain ATCC 50818 / BSB-021) TaxID=946362 RepID=F2UPY3_SALR5|nr:uncharacterized protein PTSG_10795 [Salpingoeca rosetta]EGD79813.1 hypothetical protein PTSG_10795 [Salpingoeca rosetta]|eukprot:XP_004988761.1 hypothetical protein PTSG_10795 [Salpingoeca rosetta]